MVKVLGIDEAGRGPVIGPMVMAGVVMKEEDLHKLETLGVKDSKKILPAKREILFDKIIAIAEDYHIITLSPEQIDGALNDPDLNLNWLEALTTAKIVNRLFADKAFIDCPSNNVEAYTNYLQKKVKVNTELVVEHKADDTYIVAGAASILAKVTRDRMIKELCNKYGDFGSGYPSDPKTKEFIEKNHELPIFRKTWGTWKNIAQKYDKNQKSLGDF